MQETAKLYSILANEHRFIITDSVARELDIIHKPDGRLHVIHNNRSVLASISNTTPGSKDLEITLNGNPYRIHINDPLDQMLEQMGFGAGANKQIKELKAPMPGLVLEISVQEGQTVAAGDNVLILEAMKMENSILAPQDAVIKRISVTVGQSVDKGFILIEFE